MGPRRRPRRVDRGAPVDGAAALLVAVGLVFVLEGLVLLLSPSSWRRVMEHALQLHDGQLSFIGLAAVLAGVAWVWILGSP